MRQCVRYDNEYVVGNTFPMSKYFYMIRCLGKNVGEMKNDRIFKPLINSFKLLKCVPGPKIS